MVKFRDDEQEAIFNAVKTIPLGVTFGLNGDGQIYIYKSESGSSKEEDGVDDMQLDSE